MAPVSPPVGLMKTVMVQKSVVVMVVVLGALNQCVHLVNSMWTALPSYATTLGALINLKRV